MEVQYTFTLPQVGSSDGWQDAKFSQAVVLGSGNDGQDEWVYPSVSDKGAIYMQMLPPPLKNILGVNLTPQRSKLDEQVMVLRYKLHDGTNGVASGLLQPK